METENINIHSLPYLTIPERLNLLKRANVIDSLREATIKLNRSSKHLIIGSPEFYSTNRLIQSAKRRCIAHARRSRKYGVESNLRWVEWIDILEASQGCCAYCEQFFGFEYLELEHIKPLSRGGTNTKNNICASCKGCNTKKGIKTHTGF